MTFVIQNLEKKIHAISAQSNFNTNVYLKIEEAYLEDRLFHLIKIVVKNQKANMRATFATYSEKLEDI
jgi:hypothetical protein